MPKSGFLHVQPGYNCIVFTFGLVVPEGFEFGMVGKSC